MDALGLRVPVCSASGSGVLLNTCSPQNGGRYEHNSSRVTSLRGRGLPRIKRISHTEIQRPLSIKRILASSGADTHSVETSSAAVTSNGSGNGASSKQAVLENPSANLLSESQQASKTPMFNWTTQWYPVAVIADLDKNAPTPATILGRPLAVWWDKSVNKWQVYADQCPHRLAPLSEGSISEEGHLRCSYHGWTFKGNSGECTYIPQAPKDDPLAHTSEKACVSVYPSMEQQGIIWFWPDLSQGPVNIEAAANPPPLFTEFSDPSFKYDLALRDLEYGYETLIENLMDPAHVNFAHHKIQGNRKSARPLNYKITTKITSAGFEGEDERSKAVFVAPCSFILRFTLLSKQNNPGTSTELNKKDHTNTDTNIKQKSSEEKPPKQISLMFFCIPISPGRCRFIWSFPRNFATAFFNIIPRWVGHMTNNLVLDSDMYLLHLMERRLEREGTGNWNKRFYLPTKADAYVRGFRRWLNDLAGGAPDWAGRFENQLPPSPPRRIILDRYHQHVTQCKSCSNASKTLKGLEATLQVLAIALVGLVAASALVPIRPVASLAVPLVIGAVVSTIFSKWLANFIYKTFYFHDYNHAAVK